MLNVEITKNSLSAKFAGTPDDLVREVMIVVGHGYGIACEAEEELGESYQQFVRLLVMDDDFWATALKAYKEEEAKG